MEASWNHISKTFIEISIPCYHEGREYGCKKDEKVENT